MKQLVASSCSRVQRARSIADDVRGNSLMHRLAMQTVFVLEDCHEALVRMEQEHAMHAAVTAPQADGKPGETRRSAR